MKEIFEKLYLNGNLYVQFCQHKIIGPRKIEDIIHSHHTLEISVITAGEGTYIIGDRIYTIKQGDIFVISNTEVHGIILDKNQTLTNLIIHFEPRFVWSDPTHFDSRFLQLFFDRNKNFSHQLDTNNKSSQEIYNIFYSIRDEFNQKEPEYDLMIKAKLLTILALLLRHYGHVIGNTTNDHLKELRIIHKVTDYIDHNYCDNITLKALADIAIMNPSYFSTFFKRYNGMNPTEYIARRRILHAMELLKTTDNTILYIALTSGFNSVANFNKVFKKLIRSTPSDYKKRGVITDLL